MLVTTASRSEVTALQIARARTRLHLPIVAMDARRLECKEVRRVELSRLIGETSTHLGTGSDVLLTSSVSPMVADLGREVADLLGDVVAEILRRHDVAGLFLTGGDLAVATCRALRASAIRIETEIQPGVPAGTLVGGDFAGIPIVTKAGGFGNETAIEDALTYLHGGAHHGWRASGDQ